MASSASARRHLCVIEGNSWSNVGSKFGLGRETIPPFFEGRHLGEAHVRARLKTESKPTLPEYEADGSSPLNKTYRPGALIGLPATLTGRTYSMTATVTDDAELGFVSSEAKALLHEQPQARQELLHDADRQDCADR